MKLLTWNCNGALRKKFETLQHFQAELIIIQECENPAKTKDQVYRAWANNSLWVGDNPRKGLGIFASANIKLEPLDWKPRGLKYFIPCRVNDQFNLLGTWCYGGNLLKDYKYIGQLWKYLQLHKKKLGTSNAEFVSSQTMNKHESRSVGTQTANNSIIAGDFNSNVFWDKPRRNWNHSDVVRELNEIGIDSLYHTFYKEDQGQETIPTFIFQKNVSKPYHIDYIFASTELIQNIKSVSVGQPERWLKMSDHMPVICEI
jgi:exonuclease III